MSEIILLGDAVAQLRTLEPESVNTCVISPPYYNLRDYGAKGQIGMESTPEEYIENLVQVFREVRRLLRPDGTLWVSGTTGVVAKRLGRNFAGTEINPEYWKMATDRIADTLPDMQQITLFEPEVAHGELCAGKSFG